MASQIRIPEASTATEQVPAQTPETPTTSIADPGPLGLAGFAATTFMLSVFNANLIKDPKLLLAVLPVALFYGGLAQLLAGMWEFKKGNTFGATAFSSFGAFWLSYAALVKFVAPGLPAATAYKVIGLYLLIWTVFTAYMLIASLRSTGAVALVFAVLTVTFVLLTIGAWDQSAKITHIGGWAGLVTAVVAWYASFAGVTNATWGRPVLPVVPLNGTSRRSGHRA
ncbi:MAG TPA: acetate uptake transporter [Mycobacteriales bacterium]|nr:acetate uptake transporter [Mycobacteriales bacterium]